MKAIAISAAAVVGTALLFADTGRAQQQKTDPATAKSKEPCDKPDWTECPYGPDLPPGGIMHRPDLPDTKGGQGKVIIHEGFKRPAEEWIFKEDPIRKFLNPRDKWG